VPIHRTLKSLEFLKFTVYRDKLALLNWDHEYITSSLAFQRVVLNHFEDFVAPLADGSKYWMHLNEADWFSEELSDCP
jgi:hypothetical protein